MSAEVAVDPLPYSADELASVFGPDWPRALWGAYLWMLLGRMLDERMVSLQRQGRIGFYGSATGQEATNVGAALATKPEDWVFPGLREQLVALVRGHPLRSYVHQLFADRDDPALGRQMPCHPTAREVHYVSMSSCVGTQLPHAVGLASALRRRKVAGATLVFFGDGATSVPDFHAGMNFASVFDLPVVFCCTNNQWAISLPVDRQSRVGELAEKGAAYAIPSRRVDGTDLVAVRREVGLALDRARSGEGPTMLEVVVFRSAGHSTSDDPARYQPVDWQARAQAHDPVRRLEQLLGTLGLLSEDVKREVVNQVDASIRDAVTHAESVGPPPPESLTRDVFAEPPAPPAPPPSTEE